VEHSLQQYDEMKPDVERVVREQTRAVNGILQEADELAKDSDKSGSAASSCYRSNAGRRRTSASSSSSPTSPREAADPAR